MSHQHTLSQGPYFPVRPNGSLPASIADEYRAGATLHELAKKHSSYLGRVTAELMALGVEMRRKGPATDVETRQRLTQIVEFREQGHSLRWIANIYGISRERVRQILDPGYNERRYAGKKARAGK